MSTVERLHISLADLTMPIWTDVEDNTSGALRLLRLLLTTGSVYQLGRSVSKAVMKAGQTIFLPVREAKEVRINSGQGL